MSRNHWLFKTEPGTYSIENLAAEVDGTTRWDGIRNYQARNLLRDEVQIGDLVFVYHSRVEPMAVVGEAEVVKTGIPDPLQFDPDSKYFDAKATPAAPTWWSVDVRYRVTYDTPVTLAEIRGLPALQSMPLIHRSRLSIQPVTAAEWAVISELGRGRRPR